jgi:hypothetical protein
MKAQCHSRMIMITSSPLSKDNTVIADKHKQDGSGRLAKLVADKTDGEVSNEKKGLRFTSESCTNQKREFCPISPCLIAKLAFAIVTTYK